MTVQVSLPGFNSPAAGFEQPFEMLRACHERVHRSLRLLQRLIEHIDAHGHDASSRSAASDVLRYFDVAAPLHHEDEEKHVFPAVMEGGGSDLRAAVSQLDAEHDSLEALWQKLRPELLAWRDDGQTPAVSSAQRHWAEDFQRAYEAHIRLEEELVYPAAEAILAAGDLADMGAEMAARRRQ